MADLFILNDYKVAGAANIHFFNMGVGSGILEQFEAAPPSAWWYPQVKSEGEREVAFQGRRRYRRVPKDKVVGVALCV